MNKDKKLKLQSYSMLKAMPSFIKMLRLILIFASITITLFMFIPWRQTTYGSGKVVAYSPNERQQNISSTVEGRLGKWHVQEGSHVKPGDLIVEVQDYDPQIIKRLESERAAIIQRIKALEQAEKTATINVERQKKLFDEGISSRRNYEQANLEKMKYLSEIATAKADLAKIDITVNRQRSQNIVAPQSGSILRRISGQESVVVKPGDVIAVLVPDTLSRAAELYIKGNDIPLVQIGNRVRLQFEGWPAIQFSGWPSLAVGTFPGKVAVIDAADTGHGYFRILVVPDSNAKWPEARFLRQGMRVHGWVLLGKVSIGYELWRQFNGFPPLRESPQ